MGSFFSEGGASSSFRLAIDTSCVSQPLEPWRWRKPSTHVNRATPWWRPAEAALTHAKWSAEVWLPLMVARSRWATTKSNESNATLVMYRSRANPRKALSWCQSLLSASNRNSHFWFPAISSRGPCCDGGQLRDPSLRRHHFISHNGERPEGPWLFREARFADHLRRTTQYKAPATSDTSPYLRCFDAERDTTLPPPSLLLRKRSRHVEPTHEGRMRKCVASRYRDPLNCYLSHDYQSASSKDILIAHAEGKQGGMEYQLRRAITELWDPRFSPSQRELDRATMRNDGWTPWVVRDADIRARTRKIALSRNSEIAIHFAIAFENYTNIMQRSRYCLVSEGYSPWSPRIAEAVAHGCVPVLLSPSLEPPFADLIDWSKFSVRLDSDELPRLPSILESYNHAELHANLIRVRPLFAFCIDAGGEDGCGPLVGDALPLIIFDMATKTMTSNHVAEDTLIFDTDSSVSSLFRAPRLYAGTASQLLAGAPPSGQPPQRSDVRFACNLANGTCVYTLFDQTWLCSMANTINCECALQTQENDWRFVGDVRNLIGHKTYLWKDGGMLGPTAELPDLPFNDIERLEIHNPDAIRATASELLSLLHNEKLQQDGFSRS